MAARNGASSWIVARIRPRPTITVKTITPTRDTPSVIGEGKTLVVDTVNMIAGYFDETPAPFSDQVHLVERLRLIDVNILEDQVTVRDPVMLEKPWVVTRYFRRVAGAPSGGRGQAKPASDGAIAHTFMNLDDRPCVPNVRMDENGFQVILLPQDIEAAKAKGH